MKRWARLTNLKPEQQAEWIVLHLEGHPSGIKEKIETQIGDKLEANADEIKVLLDFLRTIYEVDDMADSFEKYVKFEQLRRGGG